MAIMFSTTWFRHLISVYSLLFIFYKTNATLQENMQLELENPKLKKRLSEFKENFPEAESTPRKQVSTHVLKHASSIMKDRNVPSLDSTRESSTQKELRVPTLLKDKNIL